MADISPNGRFIAAAAFTADVKVSSVSILPLSFCNELFRIEDLRWIFSLVDFSASFEFSMLALL